MTLKAQEVINLCEVDVEVDPMNVNFECDKSPRRASIHGYANYTIDENIGNNEGKFTDLLVTYNVLLLFTIRIS